MQTLHPIVVRTAMLENGAFIEHVDFFMERFDVRPYLAKAEIKVKPPLIPGDHMSVRLSPGWRLWGFPTAAERDKFIAAGLGHQFP